MVQKCDVCQTMKLEHVPYPGLLQPLGIPDQAWSQISMDFVEGLPLLEGKSIILVVVDRFTKYAHFLPMSQPINAETVATLFMENVYKLRGLPTHIVTNRDKLFTNTFWKKLFRIIATELSMSTAYIIHKLMGKLKG